MRPKLNFRLDAQGITHDLVELSAQLSVLELLLRHLIAFEFAGDGGKEAFADIRKALIHDLQFGAEAPPELDAEVALEMQTRSVAYGRQLLEQIEQLRATIEIAVANARSGDPEASSDPTAH